MHAHSLAPWTHGHVFLGADHARNERRTRWVIALTAAMMVGEIVGGAVFGSMALLADGLHMATHAGALTISAVAYGYARRHADDVRFAFGTGKIGDLAGFTSAVVLALIACFIGYESLVRFAAPVAIRFDEAIGIAVLGLLVNIASAFILRDQPHDHTHEHDRGSGHHDHNLRSAYLHVLADAATSVLAIVALAAGLLYGWTWMDPLMGIVGALLIARWSWILMRDAGSVLVDRTTSPRLAQSIRSQIEIEGDRITDLHLWRVGPGHSAAVLTLVSDTPQAPSYYKRRLVGLAGLSHVSIEVERCPGGRHNLAAGSDSKQATVKGAVHGHPHGVSRL